MPGDSGFFLPAGDVQTNEMYRRPSMLSDRTMGNVSLWGRTLRVAILAPMAVGLILFLKPAEASADTFRLKDGRVITGKLVRTYTTNDGQNDVTRLAVEIEPGVLMGILQTDLLRSGGHLKESEKEEEYRQRVAQLDETADAHYQMGQWCAENGLRSLARAHYLRTVEFNPNHKNARSALEHTLSPTSGRWVKREEQMAERGKIYYQGKWQFPEYIPMDASLDQEKKDRAAIQKEISRLHNDFLRGSSEKSQLAAQQLSQLDNPLVIEFLSPLVLGKQRGGIAPATPALKQIYISVLSRFDTPQVAIVLATLSVVDTEQTVRIAALDVLARQGRAWAIPEIASYLRNKNPELINRAGLALGHLNAREAILPMIDALVTKHERQVQPLNNFSPDSGLSMGGPTKQVIELRNESVLAALSQITGQGQLGYDKALWRAWYASMYAPPADDLRRDL